MTWLEQTMVGFDTETTGVSVVNDRIVTAAVITRTGSASPPQSHTWLINPGIEIPARATEVHGITTEHAREHGMDPAVALEEIASTLARAMAAGFPVVAFNASYDISIVEAELDRCGLPSLASRLTTQDVRPVVDPLVLDRLVDRYRKGPRKLINMCATYGVEVKEEDLHAADADVLATLDVIQAMARVYPSIGQVELNDLHDQQIAAHRDWAANFRSWLISKGRTEDLPSLEWPIALGDAAQA